MQIYLTAHPGAGAVPITPLKKAALDGWLSGPGAPHAAWVRAAGFTATAGSICLIPGDGGGLARVLVGIDPDDDLWTYADLPGKLPREGAPYAIDVDLAPPAATRAALGWALGTYVFSRYRKPKSGGFATLAWPVGANRAAVERASEATFLVRNLINTPASDMGPAELQEAAARLARTHRARITATVGSSLLKKNYPAIHAVGRASDRAPRLIDLRWGRRGPRVTVVGKGVCFDSGGLDLKSSGGMKLMKKDMGGAAHALGLAHMIMAAKLPVRLRVLIPAVENSVAGNAMRPLDVIATRKGLTVEVGNTDAEGRLILADALAEADSEDPDLIVDFATLTGAARVALGPSLPAMFASDDDVAEAALRHGLAERDPVWRLPLHAPYRSNLDSKVADLNNISGDGFAGAIIAALFMKEFVRPETPWLHFDIMAWNPKSRSGRPEGGEAMGMRATFALIAELAAQPTKRPGKAAKRRLTRRGSK
jgi:leucyl aminopeptidase